MGSLDRESLDRAEAKIKKLQEIDKFIKKEKEIMKEEDKRRLEKFVKRTSTLCLSFGMAIEYHII